MYRCNTSPWLLVVAAALRPRPFVDFVCGFNGIGYMLTVGHVVEVALDARFPVSVNVHQL